MSSLPAIARILAVATVYVPALAVQATRSAPADVRESMDVSSLVAFVENREYEFVPDGSSRHEAPNRSQNLLTRVSSAGARVRAREAVGPEWELSLSTAAIGRGATCRALEAPSMTAEGARLELAHAGVTEWYSNEPRGLEQGWIVHARPAGDAESALRIEVHVGGDLRVEIAPEGTWATLVDAGGRAQLRYHGLAAWDADGRELPARLERHPLGLEVRVEDQGAVYPVTIDPVLGCWPWTYDPPAVGVLGTSIAVAGDVNGDGLDDLVVGAPYYASYGAAFLFLGSRSSALGYEFAWSASGDLLGEEFGASVAGVGDVDGDGFDDVVVGQPVYRAGPLFNDGGRAYLYRGRVGGLPANASSILTTLEDDALFGTSVAGAGDVNADGYDDVLVGAPGWPATATTSGRAFLFLGSSTGPAATWQWSASGVGPTSDFGASVAGVGDVNGDGRDDVAIGSPGFDGATSNTGRVSVFHGTTTGLGNSAASHLTVAQADAQFGQRVAAAGDVNGDGFDDLAIGAPLYDEPGSSNAGRAWIHLGSAAGVAPTAAWTRGGLQVAGGFGSALACAGDIDGDGRDELVVGAEYEDVSPLSDAGRIYVFYGAAGGLEPNPRLLAAGDTTNARCGAALDGPADLNADGLPDFVVGSPGRNAGRGRAQAFLGTRELFGNRPLWSVYDSYRPPLGAERYQVSSASSGDVNGDGFVDVFLGSPRYPGDASDLGIVQGFAGGAAGLATTPTWLLVGDQSGSAFARSIAIVGDVDADGYDDLVVGQPGASLGQPVEGRARLYRGGPSGPSMSASWSVEGQLDFASLGSSVSGAGDVNGDGFDDVLIGASGFTNGQVGEGRAFLYLGGPGGLAAAPVWFAEPNVAGSEFGFPVAGAGDVNGDGYDDVLIGAHEYANGATDEGAVFFYLGGPSGPSAAPSLVI